MFVLKDAVQNQIFLAPAMDMSGKCAARRVTHDRGRARYLVANPVEHAPFNAGHGRGNPRHVSPVGAGGFAEIGVDVHRQ